MFWNERNKLEFSCIFLPDDLTTVLAHMLTKTPATYDKACLFLIIGVDQVGVKFVWYIVALQLFIIKSQLRKMLRLLEF